MTELEKWQNEVRELNAEIDRLRLELKQANAYLNDAMQKIDNLHIHIVRQDAEIERLRESYNTAVRIGSELITARDAEIERLKAENAELESELEVYTSAVSRQLKRVEFLEKVADVAVSLLDTCFRDTPTIAAYLKEKENG